MIDVLFQRELEYYKDHQEELIEKYEGKFLVIKNRTIQGAYDTELEAYTEGQKKFELGTFLIQQCLPGEGSYTQTFHSRAFLA